MNTEMTKKANWHYSGDKNPDYGGFWYKLDNWGFGFADFVRIAPCSDAGGPDNWYWVETGTIHGLDDAIKAADAIKTCGYQDLIKESSTARKKHLLIDAYMSYGHYDIDINLLVQIGKEIDPYYSENGGFDLSRGPDVVLRGDARIGNYVRKNL